MYIINIYVYIHINMNSLNPIIADQFIDPFLTYPETHKLVARSS